MSSRPPPKKTGLFWAEARDGFIHHWLCTQGCLFEHFKGSKEIVAPSQKDYVFWHRHPKACKQENKHVSHVLIVTYRSVLKLNFFWFSITNIQLDGQKLLWLSCLKQSFHDIISLTFYRLCIYACFWYILMQNNLKSLKKTVTFWLLFFKEVFEELNGALHLTAQILNAVVKAVQVIGCPW